jgi:anaerobic magnesium-protoporphyrin IX monomethyl ester cyclase
MIATAQRSGARVIAAGSDATDAPEPYLRAGADAILTGEGLDALLQLVQRLDSAPDLQADRLLDGVTGIAALVGGKVTVSRAVGPARSSQHSALAAWDLVDIDGYRSVWRKAHGYFSLNMAASKGCSFRCAWCAKPIWGSQYLQRGAADVATEMAHLKQTYAPDHVWFADDIFGFRVDWVTHFARAIQAAGGPIPFTIQTRADLMSERMAQALRDAGCKEAWIGAESGSQRVLDAMNKGTTVAEILTARARLQGVGIRVGFFIQLGYLGEDLADLIATRQLIEAARPDDVGVSVSYPLPGTKFYDVVKERMRGKTHWQESNDLDMMFQGTYNSEFYRAIRNILHDQVTLEQPAAERDRSEYLQSRRLLDLRWCELLSREFQYRSPVSAAAAG